MDDLQRRFTFHPAANNTIAARHQDVRDQLRLVAEDVLRLMPSTAVRERALVLTKLEEAMMWANAGIARYQ